MNVRVFYPRGRYRRKVEYVLPQVHICEAGATRTLCGQWVNDPAAPRRTRETDEPVTCGTCLRMSQ